MRRIILILFCFPIIGLSQKYEKTISLSQFVQELKQAAKQGTGYNLENCHITYGNSDKLYLSDNKRLN